MLMDTARTLAKEIRQSPEYLEFAAAKDNMDGSDTGMALIKEYKRLQIALQMSAMAGGGMPPEEMQRFTQISSLLYAGTDTSRYLLAELRGAASMYQAAALWLFALGLWWLSDGFRRPSSVA